MDRVNQEVDSILRTLRSQPFQKLRDTEILERQHQYVDDINQKIDALETIVSRQANEEVDNGTSAAKSMPASTTSEATATSTTSDDDDSDRVRGNGAADDAHTIQTSTEEQDTRPRIRLVSRIASQEVYDGTSAANSSPVSTTTTSEATTSGNGTDRAREETKQVEPNPTTTHSMIPPNKICDPTRAAEEVEIEHAKKFLKLKGVFHQRKALAVSKKTLYDLFFISYPERLVKAYYCKTGTSYVISMYDQYDQRCVDLVLVFAGMAPAKVYPLKVINKLMEKNMDIEKARVSLDKPIQQGEIRYRVNVGSSRLYVD